MSQGITYVPLYDSLGKLPGHILHIINTTTRFILKLIRLNLIQILIWMKQV